MGALRQLGIADQVDAIVSSDLGRASQTADIIAGVCPSAWRHKDAGLREFNFGKMEGKLVDDVKSCRAELFGAWVQGDFRKTAPGGESVNDLTTRGLKSLRAASEMGRCVVVVSHGGLIKWCAVCIELGEKTPSRESMLCPHVSHLL